MNQDLSGKSKNPREPQGPNRVSHVPVKSPKIQGHGVDIVITHPAPKATGEARGDEKTDLCLGAERRLCEFAGWQKDLRKKRPPQPKKKGLPVPEGVKFIYIGAPRGKTKKGVPQHQGVVTVAWIEPSPGTLHLGFSFCSPKDRWCKVTGRNMAMARLLTPVVVPFLYDAKRTVHEVIRAVITHDFMRITALSPGATMIWERVPSWTMGLGKGVEEPKAMIYRLPKSVARIILRNSKKFDIKNLPTHILAKMMNDIAKLDGR